MDSIKKIFNCVFIILISFLFMKGNVFAAVTKKLESSNGKTATYKLKSDVPYNNVTYKNAVGLTVDSFSWDTNSKKKGTITVTYNNDDCEGSVDLVLDDGSQCDENTSGSCQALLDDAYSFTKESGPSHKTIPYEYAGKCASPDYETCRFNTVWTSARDYPQVAKVNTAMPASAAYISSNLSRHGDGKGRSGLDCSGFVWWIYNRHGVNLYNPSGPSNVYVDAMNASVNNIKNWTKVQKIDQSEAKPCDLVVGVKPGKTIPHIGLIYSTESQGGQWLYIHNNGTDGEVSLNDYFNSTEATTNGKVVEYYRLLANFDGSTSSNDDCKKTQKLDLSNSDICACDTCDNIIIKDDYTGPDTNINNCCLDGDSDIYEYKISQLFCSESDSEVKVEYYRDQCNNKTYKDDAFDSMTDDFFDVDDNDGTKLCEVYCTEEMHLKVPDQIESATGKFFRMQELTYTDIEGNEQKTKSPVITGKKTCTAKIRYNDWRDYYATAIENEVDMYNKMQKALAKYEIYKNPSVQTKDLPQEIKVNCTSKTLSYKINVKEVANGVSYYTETGVATCNAASCIVEDWVKKTEDRTDSSGNVSACPDDYCANYVGYYPEKQENVSCTSTYKEFKVTTGGKRGVSCSGGKCSTSYVKVKKNDSASGGGAYNGIKIVSDGTDTVQLEEVTAIALNDGCTSAVSNKINAESGDWTCTQDPNSPVQSIPAGMKELDMEAQASSYQVTANTRYGHLKSRIASTTKLEEGMDKCQNMFEDGGVAAESKTGQTSSNYYKLAPKAKFYYLQVYFDNNKAKDEWSSVDFGDAKCKYYYDNTDVSDVDDKVKYYSSKYGSGSENMYNFSSGITEELVTNAGSLPLDDADTFDKKFRRDSEYNAQCTWSEVDAPKKYTLYPGPQVVNQTERGGEGVNKTTGHKYQYWLYMTTYVTDYETYWEISDIGGSQRTKDKFLKEFNDNKDTCASKGYSYSTGKNDAPEANTNTENIKQTCSMNVEEGGFRVGTCETGVAIPDEKCNPYEIKETFEFRVVDPKDVFPGEDSNWDDKAINWKKDDQTWGDTKKNIEDVADEDKTFAPENLSYSYKLTVPALRAIKNHNKNSSYDDFNLVCECEQTEDEFDCGTIKSQIGDITKCKADDSGKTYWKYSCRKCKSKFLSDLANNKVDNTTLSTNIWNNVSKNIDAIRRDSKWA